MTKISVLILGKNEDVNIKECIESCSFAICSYRCQECVGDKNMIIVPIKEGENIEKALKKFKRKFEKTGIVRELRGRKTFEKPSVKKRAQLQKAIYVQHLQIKED